uniref:Piwi domain-containing protein n=1 Tax=Angiostrongylus cantonensis TaxID=6313 RepID=A0A0K0CZW3_ANGCA
LTNDCPESKPTYTYITIQKRHLTRFYQPGYGQDGCKNYVNLPSGTVVDNVVVSPILFDFYMASQIGVMEMCYRLCFLYARCRTPVSLPCPVYYAHRACEKAKEVYKSLLNRKVFDNLSQGDDDRRKIEIERRLSVNRRYPGMHFV